MTPDSLTLDFDAACDAIDSLCASDKQGRWLDAHAELIGVIQGRLLVYGFTLDVLDPGIAAGRQAAIVAELDAVNADPAIEGKEQAVAFLLALLAQETP